MPLSKLNIIVHLCSGEKKKNVCRIVLFAVQFY